MFRNVDEQHAAGDRGADRVARLPARARSRTTSGITPRMNASDVIRIGRSRMRAASIAASIDRQPPFAQLLGELDDQDRVLRRQADQHDAGRSGSRRRSADRAAHCADSAPSTASGTPSRTMNGSTSASYCAASVR